MIWMVVTADKYELPLAIEDSIRHLSKRIGITDCAICRMAQNKNVSKYKFNGQHYKVVKVDD